MTTAVIDTGGTFSMGHNSDGLLEPMYDVRHFAMAAKILAPISGISEFDQDRLLAKLKEAKLDGTQEDALVAAQLEEIAGDIRETVSDEPSAPLITVDSILQDYGIEGNIESPYRIDSIDFSFEEHYPLLKESVFKQMEQGHNVVIIGGTDTIEFYANALAKDPEYKALRAQKPNSSVVFLNSMLSFDVDPKQIGENFADGMLLANYDRGGIFTISPSKNDRDFEDNTGCTEIYDLSESFIKMSSFLSRPYASTNKFGEIRGGKVFEDSEFKSSSKDDVLQVPPSKHYDVAPPLITKNSTGAILAYMERQPNAAVVVEGGIPGLDAPITNPGDEDRIIKAVQERTNRHVPTYFVNDYVACADHDQDFVNEDDPDIDERINWDAMRPIIPSVQWRESGFLKAIKEAGGKVVDKGTVTDAYLQALLVEDASQMKPKDTKSPVKAMRPNSPDAIGIHYVPHASAFEDSLEAAKNIAPNVVISALPGGALPARHVERVRTLIDGGKKVFCGFKYGGTSHDIANENAPIEGQNQNKYAAAQPFAELVESLGVISPSTKLTGLQKHR